jgi:hypothetical protein
LTFLDGWQAYGENPISHGGVSQTVVCVQTNSVVCVTALVILVYIIVEACTHYTSYCTGRWYVPVCLYENCGIPRGADVSGKPGDWRRHKTSGIASLFVVNSALPSSPSSCRSKKKRLLGDHNIQNRNLLSSKTMTTQEALETITAMRSQECSVYSKINWLDREQNERPMSISSIDPLLSEARVDVNCRNQMSTWYLRLADACDFSSETVEIAMSLLDRFLATPEGAETRSDRGVYQLASMAALYTAVKVHETTAIGSTVICSLSCGAFSRKDVDSPCIEMASQPSNVFFFVRKLMELIPEDALDKENF